MSILDEIVKNKREELKALKEKKPLGRLEDEVGRLPKKKQLFFEALKKTRGIAIIAEIKKRSPSKGILRKNFRPITIARALECAGASALSILTDENFFGGSAAIFKKVRSITKLPLLRKDFTLDLYQIFESRLMGADAVLLIVEILTKRELATLSREALNLGLDVLFEVHTVKDIEKVLPFKPSVIGINNRDLYTFQVDIGVTERLMKHLPQQTLVISESGIQNAEDLLYLKRLGVQAVLVGESLMRQKDPGTALKNLRAGA